jgi:hypothetical protein
MANNNSSSNNNNNNNNNNNVNDVLSNCIIFMTTECSI